MDSNIGHLALQLFTFILIFGSIIFLAIVTTRYIGGKAGKSLKGKFINIVETINLSMDKQLHLIKVGEQFILVATAGKSVTFLTNFKDDSIDVEEQAVDSNGFDFKNIFDKYVKSFRDNSKNAEDSINHEASNGLKGDVFKSNLNKLRSYTTRIDNQVEQDGDDYTNDKR